MISKVKAAENLRSKNIILSDSDAYRGLWKSSNTNI